MLPKLNQTLEAARQSASADPVDGGSLVRNGRPASNNGELPGYHPATEDVARSSREQSDRVHSTRRQERQGLIRTAGKAGAIAVATVVTLYGGIKLGHRYIAHEEAPWQNTPAQVEQPPSH